MYLEMVIFTRCNCAATGRAVLRCVLLPFLHSFKFGEDLQQLPIIQQCSFIVTCL